MPPSKFEDHFSAHSADYHRHRPSCPPELLRHLSALCEKHLVTVDCGTGNGQVVQCSAEHFTQAIGIDASRAQLSEAEEGANIEYRHGVAEALPVEADSVDLVTASKAFHWFNRPRVLAEIQRILRSGGIMALWNTGFPKIVEAPGALEELREGKLGKYWPQARQDVTQDWYQNLDLPSGFQDITPIINTVTAVHYDLEQLLGWISTWSSTQNFVDEHGIDPTDEFKQQVSAALSEYGQVTVRSGVEMKVGRKD